MVGIFDTCAVPGSASRSNLPPYSLTKQGYGTLELNNYLLNESKPLVKTASHPYLLNYGYSTANFGDVFIPSDLVIPRPMEIGKIQTLEHGVSSGPVLVVDTQTLLVPDFTYDGQGPASFWWVSRGSRQHPRGLQLADEDGSSAPLPKYIGKTVVITLPPEYTIYDFDWFGVWSEEARTDFGSVRLPQDLVVPPSPRTLGIELEYKLNCEVLRDDLGYEVRWIMDGEDIVMQLVARLKPDKYMAFGLSKNDTKSDMAKADAIVAWMDNRDKGHAQDYYFGSKEQCSGRRGSCPDSKFPDGRDSVTLLNAAKVNGYTMITVKRPQVGMDQRYDQHVYSDGPQAIIWAIGQLNDKNEISYKDIMTSEGNVFIDFARSPQWNCPQPADYEPAPETTTTSTSTKKPQHSRARQASRTHEIRVKESEDLWNLPPLVCPSDKTFRAQIGPTGGKGRFHTTRKNVGSVAFYINGILAPEITLERGQTYTFVVEGGNDFETPSRTHPFYITDDHEGGYEQKTAAGKKKVKIFAGATANRRGNYTATGGRLCEWKLPQDLSSTEFETFADFQQNLELRCERGRPGRFTFKPDARTPDLLYYQCFTHRYMGWKINVVDSCDNLRHEASIQHVKNVTYNSLASDYKRGGEKKKLFFEEEQQYTRNDGIPLILDELNHEVEPKREPHYTPQPYEPPSSSEKSTVYFKMSPSPRGKQTFFVTTQHPKTLSKYSTPRPHKVVTMETFQLGDVVPSIRQRGNYPPQRPVTDYPTRGHHAPPQQHQWWNDPSKNQAGPRPTVSTLKHQLAVLQKSRPIPEGISPSRNPSQRPHRPQNKVISVVVNNEAKFHSQGSAPDRTFAVINTEQKNLVPLLVVSPKQTSRPRNDGKRPVQRIKGGGDYITSASRQIIRHAHPSNGSLRFDSRNVPLVPVVLEKNGNNFYSLQKVLSLLNQEGVSHFRRTRSADHHPDHHKHDHEHHEHEDHDHEMDKKESSEKSIACSLYLSEGVILTLSILGIFMRRV
ncbi:hypothetical protein TNCV_1910731 [Trichonephila clavipes]|nr:hypothetical protein TNCV_1910731 [Trichonephila clavipes]